MESRAAEHNMGLPGIVIAALKGGSGKTILAVGITAALKERGKTVAPFKKGPDYIDAGWLALAAGRPCYNLDTFFIPPNCIQHSFSSRIRPGDVAVIEGNRGLYDSIDDDGSTSTAELAKQLRLPVLLCIDCTKSTRTMAAVVGGCCQFDPHVRIRGIVLNRVAGKRHEGVLRRNIERYCNIPVLGAIPKLDSRKFPERHMGLVPTAEHRWAAQSIAAAAEMADRYLDLRAVEQIMEEEARGTPPLPDPEIPCEASGTVVGAALERPRIAVVQDSAFQFYYPENIEALTAAGAEIVVTSPLQDARLPAGIDALYIGGGFPETHAEALANNANFRQQIRQMADRRLPVYAECGGLMYLGEALVLEEKRYEMCGVLPVTFGFSRRPQGHGYTIIEVDRPNPYFEVGLQLKGHEFHYSRVLEWHGDERDTVFAMQRGSGFAGKRDGVCRHQVLATYTHLHALGTPSWAPALVKRARTYRAQTKKGDASRNTGTTAPGDTEK